VRGRVALGERVLAFAASPGWRRLADTFIEVLAHIPTGFVVRKDLVKSKWALRVSAFYIGPAARWRDIGPAADPAASKSCLGGAARPVTRVTRARTWLCGCALCGDVRETWRYASVRGAYGLAERLDLVYWCIWAAPARRLLGVWQFFSLTLYSAPAPTLR
jgi:hypothetical protein